MVRIFITKWVVARGIIVMDVEKPKPWQKTSRYDSASVNDKEGRFYAPLRMGVEAFYTLEEALADAAQRFETRRDQLERELTSVKRGIALLKAGKGPNVHTKFKRVSDCKAFD